MLTLSLPVAPSVNAAWLNRKRGSGRGRIKSAKYHSWMRQADAYYQLQGLGRVAPIRGFYSVRIVMPENMRGDEDNRVKPVLDWLVSRRLTPDDRYLRGHSVDRDPDLHGLFWVTVNPANG
jgi:hypothetical protein